MMALVRSGLVDRWPKGKRAINPCSNSARMGRGTKIESQVRFGRDGIHDLRNSRDLFVESHRTAIFCHLMERDSFLMPVINRWGGVDVLVTVGNAEWVGSKSHGKCGRSDRRPFSR